MKNIFEHITFCWLSIFRKTKTAKRNDKTIKKYLDLFQVLIFVPIFCVASQFIEYKTSTGFSFALPNNKIVLFVATIFFSVFLSFLLVSILYRIRLSRYFKLLQKAKTKVYILLFFLSIVLIVLGVRSNLHIGKGLLYYILYFLSFLWISVIFLYKVKDFPSEEDQ